MRKKPLSRAALEVIAARFRALSDASRLHIVQSLFDGERSVQELSELTELSQANVSKHLSVLAEQGIVAKERQGSFMYYRIADDSIYKLCDLMCSAAGKRYAKVMQELNA
jgi:DNA-binding transcriptional ArsR family regulator